MKRPYRLADWYARCALVCKTDGHIIWKAGDDRTSINDGCTVIVAEATSPHKRLFSGKNTKSDAHFANNNLAKTSK